MIVQKLPSWDQLQAQLYWLVLIFWDLTLDLIDKKIAKCGFDPQTFGFNNEFNNGVYGPNAIPLCYFAMRQCVKKVVFIQKCDIKNK